MCKYRLLPYQAAMTHNFLDKQKHGDRVSAVGRHSVPRTDPKAALTPITFPCRHRCSIHSALYLWDCMCSMWASMLSPYHILLRAYEQLPALSVRFAIQDVQSPSQEAHIHENTLLLVPLWWEIWRKAKGLRVKPSPTRFSTNILGAPVNSPC